MKIAYILMQFPVPSETFASLDIECLRQKGHVVNVYGMRPQHKEYNELIDERHSEGLSVHNFSTYSFFTFLAFLLLHPIMTLVLFFWIFRCCFYSPKHLIKSLVLFPAAISIFNKTFKDKPDVVHLFWGHYPSMVGYLVKRFMPSTIMTQFMGAHDLETAYPGSRNLSEKADAIFTHSKANLPKLKKMGINPNRVQVIVRGTNLVFPFESVITKFDELSSPTFLCAARLIKEKGVDDVLNIFSTVLKTRPKSRLFIAGDGPYLNNLKQLATLLGCIKNTIFLGHLNQVELIEHMSKAHFFLLMSRYPSERLPNVIKEAMYQRCIVITTNTDGIDELVENHVNGFVVNKSDTQTSLNYVIECLENVNKAKDIAGNAKLLIQDKFDVNLSMQKYLTVWSELIKGEHHE